jgi:adenosine deaminase
MVRLRLKPSLTMTWFWVGAVLVLSAAFSFGQVGSSAEQRTARYLESIRNKPPLLLAFLQNMPKGGDLHSHLWGAVYAESLIGFAEKEGLCIDHTTSVLIEPPCDPCEKYANKPAVACAYGDHVLYNQIVDAWSMRNWNHGEESGHDHFFATFDKFAKATDLHVGDMVAEAMRLAAADHVGYLELMHTIDAGAAADLGQKIGWTDNLPALREKLLAGGLADVLAGARHKLDQDEANARSKLHCDSADAEPACKVTVRYLYQVARGRTKDMVFAQIVTGFELAQADPRVVGLNLVMPEDWYVPMHDFDLHMHMLDYLHQVYPKVHIALHAGELAPGMVPPEGLRFHIRESVERGHAERIGHGVDVMDETDAIQLLQEMAQKNVLVEICLTSNDVILGIRGEEHPFPIYRQYGVPVTLATDDQGVSRSDMTQEYLRGAEDYRLSYADLKGLARMSLEHSFMPGKSLWGNTRSFRGVEACSHDYPGRANASPSCKAFLDSNPRAQQQWRLEQEFARFEKEF